MSPGLLQKYDVVVVGGGHNGLIAAIFLGRSGLKVLVLEGKDVIGGAVRTEYPFARAPQLRASTGAYLLGVMPPELIEKLGIKLTLLKRDPYYFVPTLDERYLLFGSQTNLEGQFKSFFSEADWHAHLRLQEEIALIREDVAAALLSPPSSLEETADQYIRPALQDVFIDLCRGSVGAYLNRFDFHSDIVKAMYATTDGFTGCFGGWDTAGTGMNFLVHNLCRLPDSDGTWMICQGGMGAVTQALKEEAIKSGVEIRTNAEVVEIVTSQSICRGVILKDQSEIKADTVVCNADPFKMRTLIGLEKLPPSYNEKLDEFARLGGTSFKLNMAAARLPVFKCLPQDLGQYRTTTHLLPMEDDVLAVIDRSFKQASAGLLPDRPLIEWYFHTTVDESLKDQEGNHSMALFVQWVPTKPKEMSWDEAEPIFVKRLLNILDEYAPGTADLVIDTLALSPLGIERRFGITGGHIFHVDHRFGFGERLPYRTPIAGLYAGGAGCHPGGGVMGAPGYNAAQAVLKDKEVALPVR